MTDMGTKLLPADGVDSQVESPHSQPRWFKPGIAFIAGSSLVLMCLTFTSGTTRQMTSAMESTNLVGLSPSLRSAVKPGIINSMSPSMLCGSSPFKDLALSAIKANNLGVRDVSMFAKMDGEVKKTLAKAGEATALKAKEILVKAEGEAKAEAVGLPKNLKDMAGVTGPLGFWDPAGFTTDCSEGKLLFYREVELKHGRVGMLAALGFLVGENFHPLFGGNIDVPGYIAFQQTPLQTFWPAVLFAIAIPETFSIYTFNSPEEGKRWTMKDPSRVPGDFDFDPLGLKPTDAQEFKVMQNKELNNGRLAMIAAAGMIAQELASGEKVYQWK